MYVVNRGPSKRVYMPQVDGVRAFAVAAVLAHHFSDNSAPFLGNAGVKLFFVLSGFLVTGDSLAREA